MSTARMRFYVPIVQKFASGVVALHSAVAERLGLHPTDLRGLRLLGEKSMSAGALGEQVGLTGAAVTALIDRLETAGYVVRERGAIDRRRVTVHVVPQKLHDLDTLYRGQHAKMSRLLSKYSAEEFSLIMGFLDQTTHILAEEAKNIRKTSKVSGGGD